MFNAFTAQEMIDFSYKLIVLIILRFRNDVIFKALRIMSMRRLPNFAIRALF